MQSLTDCFFAVLACSPSSQVFLTGDTGGVELSLSITSLGGGCEGGSFGALLDVIRPACIAKKQFCQRNAMQA